MNAPDLFGARSTVTFASLVTGLVFLVGLFFVLVFVILACCGSAFRRKP